MRGSLLAAWALLTVGPMDGAASSPDASSPDPEVESGKVSLVRIQNRGFRLSAAPALFIPTGAGRSVGFSIALQGRYGIDVGSFIVAPGGRIAAYFSDANTYLAMPTIRLTLPVGTFGPYVEGGLGIGYVNQANRSGAALSAGAGFMLYLGDHFGFGLGIDYEKITGTDFSVVSVGPSILLSF